VRDYYTQYLTLVGVMALALLLFGAMIGLGRLLAPRNMSPDKLSTYECGVEPMGDMWGQQQARYYIFAILFVVFDVEAAFIFPWANIMGNFDQGWAILVEMVVFILILAVALVYAVRKGLLRWL